jgi:REP element-mobilizing transposase RayT
MATPRHRIVSPDITAYYHCTSRCVRGSFLCGRDQVTNKNYEHRRRWLRDRLIELAGIFRIRIGAFAIMENHFHVVLFLDFHNAAKIRSKEILQRWHKIFKGTEISQRYITGDYLTFAECRQLVKNISVWRRKLCDIGWFMRCVKEPLARLANKEDDCTGRFWEGRYHSQALLDARAIAACMVYVDLNPYRAGMCSQPKSDKYTSLAMRTKDFSSASNSDLSSVTKALLPFSNEIRSSTVTSESLPVSREQYFSLLDNAARIARLGKDGLPLKIPESVFFHLGLKSKNWAELVNNFGKHFFTMAGSRSAMSLACKKLGKRHTWGMATGQSLLGP